MRVLLLGGTTEAGNLALALKSADIATVFSYAGRTNAPVVQPVPTRVGGFGGIDGLADYLRAEQISHVVDATHPFAATMGSNAHHACKVCNIPILRLERPAWTPMAEDRWSRVPTIKAACDALPTVATNIFLAIGRMHIDLFAQQPRHHYLLRLVDTPDVTIPLPHHTVTVARGPFDMKGDIALMQAHNITHIIAKNAGGIGAVAKIDAARQLGLNVIMIDRPVRPIGTVARDIETVLRWLDHIAERGV